MGLKDTLKLIQKVSEKYLIDKPYIVGGLPRDIYMAIPNVKTTDVDLTTNSPDVLRLGVLVADELNVTFELAEDGHITVFSDEFDLDFSSHFVSDKVVDYLNGKYLGLEEAFSRDFTINTLHQDLVNEKIVDPTEMGFQDIEDKIIRTPVPPEITLTDDPRRAYRAINLAIRYGFDIDPEIIDFVLHNQELFGPEKIKDKYITVKINKSLGIDSDLTIKLLKEMNLFDKVPLSGTFKDVLIEKKLLVDYLGPESKNLIKDSQLAHDWIQYSAQGLDYQELSEWWQHNANKMPGNYNSSYQSWDKWYMEHYRGPWQYQHHGPVDTLKIMQEELYNNGNNITYNNPLKSLRKNPNNFLNSQLPLEDHFEVSLKPGVNIENVSDDVKSFIEVLGREAKLMGMATPIITSGWRSIEEQAQIMGKNWKDNGGMKSGRRYLMNLYGEDYGGKVADVFEKHGIGEEGQALAIQVIKSRPIGSSHILSPGQAIDLSLTSGIKKVLDSIESKNLFNLKIVNESGSAGPHYHVTIKSKNDKKALIIQRKEEIKKLATTNY